MNVEIITVGDELLIGQVVDTNSAWMGNQLNMLGMSVVQITSITDSPGHLVEAVEAAKGHADIILITGGLGPTSDDRTKETLCDYFRTELVLSDKAYENVSNFFARLGRDVDELNYQQALMPRNCDVLANPYGTACGMWFEEDGVIFVSMPGVPSEMKHIMENSVLPRLAKKSGDMAIVHKTVSVLGIGESTLATKLQFWEANLPECISLAYLPNLTLVRLRLTAIGSDEIEITRRVEDSLCGLYNILGDAILGEGDTSLAGRVLELLEIDGASIATAESCSGGTIAQWLTAIPGSSASYVGSIVAYSNAVKQAQLGVRQETLDGHGAVSAETVEEMALGLKDRMGSTYALAVSGIAGPGGGTEEKPVGTVWFALAGPDGVISEIRHLPGNRTQNIEYSAMIALNILRLRLLSVKEKG